VDEYTFDGLTKEVAAQNIRSALATFFQGTKQQHALIDASLALCGLAETSAATQSVPEPLA
jgi:hypothetical protein